MKLESIKLVLTPAPEVTEEQVNQIKASLDMAMSMMGAAIPGNPTVSVECETVE